MNGLRFVADRARRLAVALDSNFFVLPAVAVLVAAGVARLVSEVDASLLIATFTVDSARAVLTTVAAATITFASIAFSISLLIVQQGASQYSPRVIHGLTRDPFNRRVVAVVMGTFAFCLVTLADVRGVGDDATDDVVPQLAVSIGLVAGVVSVLAVVGVLHHTTQQMDVSKILGRIVDETLEALDTAQKEIDDEGDRVGDAVALRRRLALVEGQPCTVVRFHDDGWVSRIDRERLLAATEPGGTIRLGTDAGRYATRQTECCRIWPAVPADREDEVRADVRAAFGLGGTRTMEQDTSYGIRQLVDVALRALSPGVNDPTTALDAMFQLGTLLVAHATAPSLPALLRGDDDRALLMPYSPTDESLAELALAELRSAAAELPDVAIYVMGMVGDVAGAAAACDAADRVAPLAHQASLLMDQVERHDPHPEDLERVRRAFENVPTT